METDNSGHIEQVTATHSRRLPSRVWPTKNAAQVASASSYHSPRDYCNINHILKRRFGWLSHGKPSGVFLLLFVQSASLS
jgi:hypothetical protein